MAQGLQLSTLMSGADQALRFDGAGGTDAEQAESASGSSFGELLNGMASAATDKVQGGKLRQLPAGISLLSGVSQALAAAKAGSTETTELTDANMLLSAEQELQTDMADADAALLAASLLGQIALKDKTPLTDAEAKAVAAELAIMLQTQTDGTEQGANAETEGADTLLTTQQQAVLSATQGEAKPAAAAATALAEQPLEAKSQTAPVDAKQLKAEQTETALSMTDAASGDIEAAEAVTKAAQPVNLNEVASAAGSAPGNTPAERNTLLSAATEAEQQANLQQNSAALQPDAAAGDKTKPELVGSAVADKSSQSVKLTAMAENGTKTGSDSSDGSAKQNSGQQNSPQNLMAQLAADSQTQAQDSSVAVKTTAEQAGTARSEAAFSHNLQAAEQRQQSGLQKTAAKAPAEQLQQSLNLLQQDAAGQLRERVNLMVRQNIQVAEIRLDPAGLGQMQIKIDMQQDQASVQFIVQQPQAKELLEQQLPRLREMLQQQGIVLGEGNVQQQTQQQQERQLAQGNGRDSGMQQTVAEDTELQSGSVSVTAVVNERLVDYYA
ncbi:flagellar hook-length control protein FliK [Rheinheimera sp. YQF-2]|uniref:Flagellar hook-length control protein FliK n=1 Tax=Rheinheimera lutimaris TaxID=2740584 RepID=A0A7Y5APU7_9GAMM|nr:flagellar hook-length control protein FliK [Rheinheimera lutimaris]NRQ42292.1 flagellar hook-length control protein FliK [Rheinheimera lutimaris]